HPVHRIGNARIIKRGTNLGRSVDRLDLSRSVGQRLEYAKTRVFFVAFCSNNAESSLQEASGGA
ncbi:MAG TPA: hypothetical protein VFW87_00410, partial [Pirellulales bacterium]|nr:hypothetical protein [Pirellulales bacterium]